MLFPLLNPIKGVPNPVDLLSCVCVCLLLMLLFWFFRIWVLFSLSEITVFVRTHPLYSSTVLFIRTSSRSNLRCVHMYVFVISFLKMGKKLEKIVGDNCSVSLRHEKNKYDNNN